MILDDFNLLDNGENIEDFLKDIGEDIAGLERFATVVDIEAFKESRIPKNTRLKAAWAVKIFTDWLSAWRVRCDGINKVFKPMEEMSLNEMDHCLQYFFAEVRKKDGSLYPPRTMKELAAMIQHHLNYSLKVVASIFKDPCFLNCREALDAAMKASARAGTVKPRKRAAIVTWDMEEEMWTSGAFGYSSPQQLIDTLIYHLGLHLSLRAVQEQRDLEYGCNSQLQLKKDKDGVEFLSYMERTSKCKSFGLNQCRREPKTTTIYPHENQARCIIRLYKTYLSHR